MNRSGVTDAVTSEPRPAEADAEQDKAEIVALLEDGLARLDEIGATLPAAHLSLALETFRTWPQACLARSRCLEAPIRQEEHGLEPL